VLARFVRNRFLADACYRWAFSALTTSPGARAFYDEHRARDESHDQALRTLAQPPRRDPRWVPAHPRPL